MAKPTKRTDPTSVGGRKARRRRRGQGVRRPPQTSAPATVGRLITRTELASDLGVNPITITKWQGEGLPVAVRGGRGVESKYRMAEVWRWGLARERARAGAGGAGADMSLPVERAKLARVQTRKADLEIRKREGELLEATEVMRLLAQAVLAIRSGILRLPTTIAGAIVACVQRGGGAPDITALLRPACEDLLRELAAWEGPASVGPAAAAPVEATAS